MKLINEIKNEIKVAIYQLILTKEGVGKNNPLFKMDKDAFCQLLLNNKELDARDIAFLINEHKKRYQATNY